MADFECAKPTHFDIALLLQRFFYRIEKSVDDTSTIFFGDHWPSRLSNLSRYVFDQIGFSHRRDGAGPELP